MNSNCLSSIKFKKCVLFTLLCSLTALICANVMITCWLLHILHITPSGIKDIFFSNTSVLLNRSVWIQGNLHTSFIRGTRKGLHLVSDDSVHLSAPESSLTLKSEGIHFLGKAFLMESVDGTHFLNFTQDTLKASVKTLNIRGSGNLIKSLQTEEVKSYPESDLRIISRTNGIRMESRGDLRGSAPAGNITLNCLGTLHLSSQKTVFLSGGDLLLPSVKRIQGDPVDVSYQLCICKNGRLFSVPARLSCLYGNRHCFVGHH